MRISDWSSDVCSSDLAFPGDRLCSPCSPWTAVAGRCGRAQARPGTDDSRHDVKGSAVLCAAAFRKTVMIIETTEDDYAAMLRGAGPRGRSEEHTSELQSLMRISYAVFCLKKKKITQNKSAETKHKKNIFNALSLSNYTITSRQ